MLDRNEKSVNSPLDNPNRLSRVHTTKQKKNRTQLQTAIRGVPAYSNALGNNYTYLCSSYSDEACFIDEGFYRDLLFIGVTMVGVRGVDEFS